MKPTVLGVILVSHSVLEAILVSLSKEIGRSYCKTSIQPHNLMDEELSQLSLPPSLLLMLQVNERLHNWPYEDIAMGFLP